MLTTKEVRAVYGKLATWDHAKGFQLVHLDSPSRAVRRQRIREFDPAKFFEANCPLCNLLKERGVIVFDESRLDEEGAL